MTFSFFPLARPVSTFLWLGAFLCSLYLVEGWELGFIVGAVFLLSAWAWTTMSAASHSDWQIPKSPVLAFAAAFWVLTFLSILWAELPLISLSAFCFFSAMPLTFLVFTLSPDERQFRQIAIIGTLIFTALAIWAVVQNITGYNPFNGQAHAPLADPNALGAFFNIALIPAVVWALGAKGRWPTVAAFAFAAVMMAGLMATGSRGAFFSLLPALIVLFVWAGVRFAAVWRRGLCLVVIFTGLLIGGQFVASHEWNATLTRIGDTVTLKQPDITNNRIHIWDGALATAQAHWLHGTGFGTFFLYYPEFRSPEEPMGVSHAHNDPLQFWAELGVLGPVLFYAFVIAALVRSWRALAQLPKGDARRIRILVPLCVLGALVIQSHVTFIFYNLCILFGAGFLLAVWFVETQRVLDDKVMAVSFPPSMRMAARRLLLAMPFVPFLFMFASYMGSEYFVNKARDALLLHENLPEFAANLRMAHEWDRGLNFRTWLLAANIPLGILQEASDSLSDEKKKEFYEQALGQLERVRALNPRSSAALFYQAKLQTLVPEELRDQDQPTPEELYKEAVRIDPVHLGPRLALADLYAAEGRDDDAFAVLKDGFRYSYGASMAMDYYGRMMVEFLSRGDKEGYQQAIDNMVTLRTRMQMTAQMQKRQSAGRLPVGSDAGLN